MQQLTDGIYTFYEPQYNISPTPSNRVPNKFVDAFPSKIHDVGIL